MYCRMQKKRADIIFGPHIHFREYSLLDNPRMPASIKDDELLVGICQVMPHPWFSPFLEGERPAPLHCYVLIAWESMHW